MLGIEVRMFGALSAGKVVDIFKFGAWHCDGCVEKSVKYVKTDVI